MAKSTRIYVRSESLSSLCRISAALSLLGGLGVALSACTYGGEDLNFPLAQRFLWTGVVNADDLRAGCEAGTPNRWRAVYNGSYEEQLRIYDLTALPEGGARLQTQVQESADLTRIGVEDPLAPWKWQRSETEVGAAALADFDAALTAEGFGERPPVGTRLDSRGYYWVVTACREGAIDFQVWRDPQDAPLNERAFVRWLAERDASGLPLAPPRPFDRFDPAYDQTRTGGGGNFAFTFTVREDGLGGPGRL